MTSPWHLYLMALVYLLAGGMHFIKPRMYLAIMPPFLPFPKLLVAVSGIMEMALGLAICFEPVRDIALYGMVLMLLLFLMVHFHMLRDKKASLGLPRWALVLRIPLQFALIYWAISYL
jgi:uncharacterized membrane protein